METTHQGRTALTVAIMGLITTLATGAACIGPFVAILLGVSGFGWLTRYAYLRVPASLLTLLVLGYGFYRLYRHPAGDGARAKPCSRPNPAARACLWAATTLAIGVNLFEYLVLPRL